MVAGSEWQRLQLELAAARAEIARLRSENALLKAGAHADGPVHRSQRAPSLFGLGDEVPLDV